MANVDYRDASDLDVKTFLFSSWISSFLLSFSSSVFFPWKYKIDYNLFT